MANNSSRATGANVQAPPVLSVENYGDWKKELVYWKALTKLKPAQMGPAMILHGLSGPENAKAKAAAMEIDPETITSDNGLVAVIAKLDELYLESEEALSYTAYEEFVRYTRGPNESIESFIVQFDNLLSKLKRHKVEMPDAALAYILLTNCRLSEGEEKLIRTTVSRLTYKDMRESLKKLIGQNKNELLGSVKVKQENSAFEAHDAEDEPSDSNAFYGRSDRGYRNGPRGYRGYGRGGYARGRGGNQPANSFRGTNRQNNVCHHCGSRFHFIANCPEKDKQKGIDDVKVTLFSEYTDNEMQCFVAEEMGFAILDSGCTRTVSGERWLNCYYESLDDDMRRCVSEEKSSAIFRFGSGEPAKSLKRVTVPATIAGKNVNIVTEVVDLDIPMLMSKDSMKTAQTKIDFTTNRVEMFGKPVVTVRNNAGHFCISMIKEPSEVYLTIEGKSETEIKTIAQKLHRQFAHASGKRINELVKRAGHNHPGFANILDVVRKECDVCKRFNKPPPRPVVSLPLSTQFNEVVSMDLKHVGRHNVLHIVDTFTRFRSAAVVENKEPDTIIQSLFTAWIGFFGTPKKFLVDNGGEFNNKHFLSLAENCNIRVLATSAESPWSNGVCERQNAILGEDCNKIMADTGCSVEVAVAWAVSARNALSNSNGFSPSQLAIGQNPSIPCVENSGLPALEGKTTSQIIAHNLNAMHAARQQFVRNESSERLRRALLRNVRSSGDVVTNGDLVYYKRAGCDEWKGPGTVFGRDGQQVLVRHGGANPVRVHSTRVRLVEQNPDGVHQQSVDKHVPNDETGEERELGKQDDKCTDDHGGALLEKSRTTDFQIIDDDFEEGNDEHTEEPSIQPVFGGDVSSLKIGQRIRLNLPDNSDVLNGKIISRAGKATGANKHCWNVKLGDDTTRWVDFSDGNFEIVEDDAEVLVARSDDSLVSNAKQAELDLWEANDVYEVVPFTGQSVISLRWVMTEKIKDGKTVVKARLVARGFEETLEERCDSPTCTKENIRLALVLMACFGWEINAIDVKSAFLQGQQIERDVFVQPPPEVYCEGVWKLKKTVYGLNDAARAWYTTVYKYLVALDVDVCPTDSGFFTWRKKGEVCGIMCVHVDDIMWGGNQDFYETVICALSEKFKIGSSNSGAFKYLGLDLYQSGFNVTIGQEMYIRQIKPIVVQSTKLSADMPLVESQVRAYRSLVGSLAWAASQTRPDFSFDVCDLSVKCKHPTLADALRANKVLKKLHGNDNLRLRYAMKGFSWDSGCLNVFSDASFANLPDGSSQGGWVVMLCDANHHALIDWQSKKLQRVAKSTLTAETLACVEAIGSALLLREVFYHCIGKHLPIECFSDNQSLVAAVHSTNTLSEKRLRIEMAELRELVDKKTVKICWIPAERQIADCLTKKDASALKLIQHVFGDVY